VKSVHLEQGVCDELLSDVAAAIRECAVWPKTPVRAATFIISDWRGVVNEPAAGLTFLCWYLRISFSHINLPTTLVFAPGSSRYSISIKIREVGRTKVY
jgi:hypothetical protein